jgi:hypothetical protein
VKKLKKILIITVLTGAILFCVDLIISISFGSISYIDTIMTKYHDSNNDNIQEIETLHFSIDTPKDWSHIAGGVGCGYYGYFFTENGFLNYEYGFYAPSLGNDEWIDEEDKYEITDTVVGDLEIRIAVKGKETGIHIPHQKNKHLAFTIYPSEVLTESIDEFIEHIEFKDN